jgi:hypothetical protein
MAAVERRHARYGAETMMPAARISGTMFATLCLVLLSACAEAPGTIAQPGPPIADSSPSARIEYRPLAPEPSAPAAIQEAVALAPRAVAPPAPDSGKDEAVKSEPVAAVPVAAVPAPPPASHGAVKAAPLPAKTPARSAVAPATIEPPRKSEAPPPVVKNAEPSLDVAALKTRLRDTKAIGVFTKLALKNQVDDLMQQFRAQYLIGPNTSVAALRQPFDMLILKVLALIQDNDPSLAKTISGSREAIWGILADPEKFNSAS